MKAPVDVPTVVGTGDAVVEQHAAGAQLALDEVEVGRVVAHPDVLGQPDRGDGVEPGLAHVAVVGVTHLGQVLQTLTTDRLLGPAGLLGREGGADDVHAPPRGIPDHASPAAADVEQPVALLEAQLVEDEAVLVLLRLLEGGAVVRVARAGVGHRRAEDVLVEGVGDVVVVVDRLGIAGLGVPQALCDTTPAGQRLLRRGRGRLEQLDTERPGDGGGGLGRRHPEVQVTHRVEQLVGVTGVDAHQVEVAGDVGPRHAQVAGSRGEVARASGRLEVESVGRVLRAGGGPVERGEPQREAVGRHGVEDLGHRQRSGPVSQLWESDRLVLRIVTCVAPPWSRGRAVGTSGS